MVDAITPERIEAVLIEAATVGDFYVPSAGHVWRIDRVGRIEHPKVGVVYELYKHKDDPTRAIHDREGTKVRCIRRPF